jgi:hypothetical protein
MRPMLLLITLACCGGALDLPVPEDLPERVYFRDDAHGFNRDWYLALRDGRVWVKPNEETGERAPGDWELLGNTGIPEGGKLVNFDPPSALASISADGTWLLAISTEGVIYRASDLRTGLGGGFSWTDRWGWPAARGDGLTADEPTARGWSVSDSHPFDVDHYEDVFGIEHSVGLGVAHVYRVSPDGARIHYNDWWLPADWSRQLCAPGRGGLRILAMSASGSTLFVLTEDGGLHTRLWDFDTAGENDTLTYSYLEENVRGTVRGLPAEPWVEQPGIVEGRITDRITIFQDGEGNAARVLRVEGTRDGARGFFEKRIDGGSWSFVATGQPLRGRLEDERGLALEEVELEPRGLPLQGTLSRQDSALELGLEIQGYDLFCSPATVEISYQGRPLEVDGQPLELELHHVHAMLDETRPDDWWARGESGPVRGALLLSEDIGRIDDAEARQAVSALLGEREVLNFRGEADAEGLRLEEIPRSDLFHVPRKEKGKAGELFVLEAR